MNIDTFEILSFVNKNRILRQKIRNKFILSFWLFLKCILLRMVLLYLYLLRRVEYSRRSDFLLQIYTFLHNRLIDRLFYIHITLTIKIDHEQSAEIYYLFNYSIYDTQIKTFLFCFLYIMIFRTFYYLLRE